MIPTKEQFLVALKQIEGFSPAPVILSNAMRLMRDPESDIDSIAALVGRDSALVADILRCANSSYYGSLINLFVASTAGMLVISVISIGIFSAFMLYDLKQI